MSKSNNQETIRAFNKVCAVVKKDENYVPRDYKTIGGMWTTDMWRFNEITYRLESDGYVDVIYSPSVYVYKSVLYVENGMAEVLTFHEGTEQDLINLADSL